MYKKKQRDNILSRFLQLMYKRVTSSSAVAKRPRDALCLSVVSFNSTKRRAQSFIVSYIYTGYKFISAVLA